MDKFLIKNTTRAEREQIVKEALGYSDIGCDDAMDGYDMYVPYIEGEKDGKEYQIINFPAQKGKDDKYYNHCWFKIEDDLKSDIIAQLQKLV